MLEHDPKADVQVERPSSERVTTAFTSEMMKNAPPGSVTLAMATTVTRIDPDKVTLKQARWQRDCSAQRRRLFHDRSRSPARFLPAQWAACARGLAAHHLDQLSSLRSLLRRALSLEEQSPAGIPGPALGESSACLPLQRSESDRRSWRQNRGVVKPRDQPPLHHQAWPRESLLLLHAHLLRLRADLRNPAYPAAAHALCEMADDRAHLLAVDSALHSARAHPPMDGSQWLFRARSSVALAR